MSNIPVHVQGLVSYLLKPSERANEDLTISFFRHEFGEQFSRQADASNADGYVAGMFILELKTKPSDWFIGLLQGLAYHRQLDFSQVVVCSKEFLAVWSIKDLPHDVVVGCRTEKGPPSSVGRKLAKKFASQKNRILSSSAWILHSELMTDGLFAESGSLTSELKDFVRVLKSGKKVRIKVTTDNFTHVLKQMANYFDPNQPLMAVRAFYSLIFGWTELSKVEISHKSADQVTLSGETITSLIPDKRASFAEFVEQRYIHLNDDEHIDDFFAKYDAALDAVDSGFRMEHGIYFTDLDLSRLAIWYAKQKVGDIGKNYLVVDPACGSGNLVMNWRSPLELRHKVVSEIEPELLFAVERRMKSDLWHHGRFTVVPKVSEHRGLNFLDVDAKTYLNILRDYLTEKGHSPDKPLAFLCNPPYRNDDDQRASSIGYVVDPSIVGVTGKDASAERYCCFLAQMKNLCEVAKDSGLPGDSLLLLFTKSAWLTRRPIFERLRREILSEFEDLGGFLITGREFFALKGRFPIAFSVWRYVGRSKKLNVDRSIPLLDLTWLNKNDLASISWSDTASLDRDCRELFEDDRTLTARIGVVREHLDSNWAGTKIKEFQRDRRKAEIGRQDAGGLPTRDGRRGLKKTYGEVAGTGIGFMDDLTPCRIKSYRVGTPWFRLNKPVMDVRKTRCFSGPPDQKGYCAENEHVAERLFLWYSTSKVLDLCGYPMWCDSDKLWVPQIPRLLENEVERLSYAIGYADNECIEAYFPANDPVSGLPQLHLANPMTPLHSQSFWCQALKKHFRTNLGRVEDDLVSSVDALYRAWGSEFSGSPEILVSYTRPYFLENGVLTRNSGIRQIVDYANETRNEAILSLWRVVQENLKSTKKRLYSLLVDNHEIGYFSSPGYDDRPAPEQAESEEMYMRRAVLAGYIVDRLHKEPTFGRTKFTKVLYLVDARLEEDLGTEYFREAAGPLDPIALYHKKTGLEALAAKHRFFSTKASVNRKTTRSRIEYTPGKRIKEAVRNTEKYFEASLPEIEAIIELLRRLNTERCEILATLYACWNDLLLTDKTVSNERIIDEFLDQWHDSKRRFGRNRLRRALEWMASVNLIPNGRGKKTIGRHATKQEDLFRQYLDE